MSHNKHVLKVNKKNVIISNIILIIFKVRFHSRRPDRLRVVVVRRDVCRHLYIRFVQLAACWCVSVMALDINVLQRPTGDTQNRLLLYSKEGFKNYLSRVTVPFYTLSLRSDTVSQQAEAKINSIKDHKKKTHTHRVRFHLRRRLVSAL